MWKGCSHEAACRKTIMRSERCLRRRLYRFLLPSGLHMSTLCSRSVMPGKADPPEAAVRKGRLPTVSIVFGRTEHGVSGARSAGETLGQQPHPLQLHHLVVYHSGQTVRKTTVKVSPPEFDWVVKVASLHHLILLLFPIRKG